MSDVIYQGDQGTVLQLTIKDSNKVVDLTDATVTVLIRLKDMGILKAATIVDSVNGKCEITLNSQDIQYEGIYQIQGTVTFVDGTKFSSSIQRFTVNKKMGYIPSTGGGNGNGGGSTEVISGNNGHILVDGMDIKVYDDATVKQDISTLKNSDLATSNSINNINISLSGISTDMTDLKNNKHNHSNLSVLNQLSTDGTNLLFNGASITVDTSTLSNKINSIENTDAVKRLGVSVNGKLTIDGVEVTVDDPTSPIDGGTFTSTYNTNVVDGGEF